MDLGQFLNVAVIISVFNATIRSAVPIILGSLSGIVSERSGVVNIAIEGMILAGAYVAFLLNVLISQSGTPEWLQAQPLRLGISISGAMVAGAALAMLHATLAIRYKVDQIISGTVINIFSAGLTSYLYLGGQNTLGSLPLIPNPFPEDQGILYVIGEILFDKNLLTYVAFALVLAIGFALFRTTWGLRTRAIGENPRAADTLGVNVHRLQYTNLAISGVLAGLAGAVLVQGVSFERGMSSGRGFIALAVMIFGMWRPSRAMLGALLFGFASALQSQLQFMQISIPHKFVAMLPYVLTLIVLAGFVGRARPPAHVGQAYEVE
ncbi:MAG: ABC transporter permease [Anaerolineae bacterium]|nr:ABC transporter permease [Anaerolineae bacterium]